MRKYSMIFFIKQSLSGLFRNGAMSLTSVFVLTSCLLLMGCFGFFMINVNINLDQLDDMNHIVFNIDRDFDTEEELTRIESEIGSLPNVRRIRRITRREALDWVFGEILRHLPDSPLADDPLFRDKVEEADPMWDAIEIEYYDIRDLDTLRFHLMAIDGYAGLRDSAEVAQFILDFRNVVMAILIWFLLVLFVIAIFIILNTVKMSVHSRKNEITIMRYIGATNFFILFPFLLEGVIIGIVAAVAAYILVRYIYGLAVGALEQMASGINYIDFSEAGAVVFVIFVLVGVMCGLLGSSISSRKHLQA